MNKRVCIIGGGFYGCNLALSVKDQFPNSKIDIYEKEDQLLTGAISNCQNRLHLGFHYGRCPSTVKQSVRCFNKFLGQYGKHTLYVNKNMYLIHKDSKVKFQDYVSFMKRNGLTFNTCNVKSINNLTNREQFEGAIKVSEMVFNPTTITNEIVSKLHNTDIKVKLNSKITHENIFKLRDQYDYVINATYTQPHLGFNKSAFQDLKFEVCLIPIFYLKDYDNSNAITVMDGEFCSLYPTSTPGCFTLSSVVHTPFFKSEKLQDCIDILKTIDSDTNSLQDKTEKIVNHAKQYFDINYQDLKLVKNNLTIKCKIKNDINDTRECFYVREGNYFSIMAGKVSAIYDINDSIIEEIQQCV